MFKAFKAKQAVRKAEEEEKQAASSVYTQPKGSSKRALELPKLPAGSKDVKHSSKKKVSRACTNGAANLKRTKRKGSKRFTKLEDIDDEAYEVQLEESMAQEAEERPMPAAAAQRASREQQLEGNGLLLLRCSEADVRARMCRSRSVQRHPNL